MENPLYECVIDGLTMWGGYSLYARARSIWYTPEVGEYSLTTVLEPALYLSKCGITPASFCKG